MNYLYPQNNAGSGFAGTIMIALMIAFPVLAFRRLRIWWRTNPLIVILGFALSFLITLLLIVMLNHGQWVPTTGPNAGFFQPVPFVQKVKWAMNGFLGFAFLAGFIELVIRVFRLINGFEQTVTNVVNNLSTPSQPQQQVNVVHPLIIVQYPADRSRNRPGGFLK